MAFALHSLAFEALLPVFLDYPKYNSPMQLSLKFFGGFGMDSETIGLIYAIQGAVGITLHVEVLGTMNGLATSVSGIGRALAAGLAAK
ncbi:hypothetical protein KEM56_006716 [Ascosphaera pollenicola]|nr:hypothetical protein KEM56_006716 [Ascosphaera pollenicola]